MVMMRPRMRSSGYHGQQADSTNTTPTVATNAAATGGGAAGPGSGGGGGGGGGSAGAIPTTRSARTTHQLYNDVFEGLPVRRWKRQPVAVSQTPKQDDYSPPMVEDGANSIARLAPGTAAGGDGGVGIGVGVSSAQAVATPPPPTTTEPRRRGRPSNRSRNAPATAEVIEMPKDVDLLPPFSRALLYAARAGCKYVRVPHDYYHANNNNSNNSNRGDGTPSSATSMTTSMTPSSMKPTGQTDHTPQHPAFQRSFITRKWAVVPHHIEPPEPDFLVERRPEVLSLYANAGGDGAAAHPGGPGHDGGLARKTKFKKIDSATGVAAVYEAIVPEGYIIEGEINAGTDGNGSASGATPDKESSTIPAAATPAPGTVIDGVGVADKDGLVVANVDETLVTNVLRRRFPPPPKRKHRGPGRGRKKRVMFAHADVAMGTAEGSRAGGVVGDLEKSDSSKATQDQADEEVEGDNDGEESDDNDNDNEDENEDENENRNTDGEDNDATEEVKSRPQSPASVKPDAGHEQQTTQPAAALSPSSSGNIKEDQKEDEQSPALNNHNENNDIGSLVDSTAQGEHAVSSLNPSRKSELGHNSEGNNSDIEMFQENSPAKPEVTTTITPTGLTGPPPATSPTDVDAVEQSPPLEPQGNDDDNADETKQSKVDE